MSRLLELLCLPWRKKLLFAEIVLLLAIARAAVVLLPFRWVARCLGTQQDTKTFTQDVSFEEDARNHEVRRLGAAVRKIAGRIPWKCKCLEQAIAAKLILLRRGIPSAVYFGVKHVEGNLQAHTWIRSGAIIATGGGNHRQFTIINVFADKQLIE